MGENFHAAHYYQKAIGVDPRASTPQVGLMASIIAHTGNGEVAIYNFEKLTDL